MFNVLCALRFAGCFAIIVLIEIPSFAASSAIEGTKWMTELYDYIKNKELNEVIIPSAHDAGTSGITPASPVCNVEVSGIKTLAVETLSPSLLARMSRAQDLTIPEQLEIGIRSFDLRYCPFEGRYFVSHSLINNIDGQDSNAQINAIGKFLQDHPRELVIIKLKVYGLEGKDGASVMEDFLNKHFAKYKEMIAGNNLTPTSKFSDFINNNKRLILILDLKSNDFIPRLWREDVWAKSDTVRSFWTKDNSSTKLFEDMKNEMSLRPPKKSLPLDAELKTLVANDGGGLALARIRAALHIAQFIVTAQTRIAKAIKGTTLLEASEIVHKKMIELITSINQQKLDSFNLAKANIILIDNVGYRNGELVKLLYMLNKK